MQLEHAESEVDTACSSSALTAPGQNSATPVSIAKRGRGRPRNPDTVLDGSFTNTVQQVVAKRTGYRCSNPRCRKPTMGPHSLHPDSFEYVGECAHICANQSKGERYDNEQTMEQRGGIANAIHMCCTCHTLIDHPGAAAKGYTAALMREWKQQAEAQAERALLRGESAERVLGELQAEVKLLTLQVKDLQQAVNNANAIDDEETDTAEPF